MVLTRAKRWLFVGFLSSVVLVGSNTASVERLAQVTPGRKACSEFIGFKKGRCSAYLRPVSSNYAVKGSIVYWVTRTHYKEQACARSMGALFSNMFSLSCWREIIRGFWTSKTNEPYDVELRDLYEVTKYSPAFYTLERSESRPVQWQREQLKDYAKDEMFVYFKNRKIEGVDPKEFSVIFPFGKSKKWQRYSVSRSGRNIFLGSNKVDGFNLNEFRALIPVLCPGHGLSSCTREREDIFFKYGRLGEGVLGEVGSDVIFLRPDGVTRFPHVVSSDMFMFASSERLYIYNQGRFYELTKDGMQFIDMDAVYFERHSRW